MKYVVITEPQAEADMAEAYRWIAINSPFHAAKWVQGMEAAILSLDWSPQRCSRAPEADTFGKDIRQLLQGNYRILFTICETTVHVLHVRHGAREHIKPEEQ